MLVYKYDEEIKEDDIIKILSNNIKWVKQRKGPQYYNGSVGFDIETTSTYDNNSKIATMYEWTFGINENIVIGRTWQQFIQLLTIISNYYQLDNDKRIIIYIHNLAFEFQFLRKWLEWSEVFAMAEREPLKCFCTLGFEFRCSYLLSGYSLMKVAENLTSHKIKKLKGDLDYRIVRHSATPLSKKELQYCINDVMIILYYIDEQIELYGSIIKIPLTNTGRVRNKCRKECLYEQSKNGNIYSNKNYRSLISSLTLTVDEYKILKRAFQGGFTHANSHFVGEVLENVTSLDFTSSYPAVIVTELFPMSKGRHVAINGKDEFLNYLRSYCCIFDIKFVGLKEKLTHEHYLSSSRCKIEGKYEEDNGRIVWADKVTTTLTEVDLSIILKFYDYDEMYVHDMWIYEKGHLPKEFIKAVLSLYKDKTKLKGIADKIVEYMNAKGMLNSCFGMMVMDIVRDIINYNNQEWSTSLSDMDEDIEKYNEDPKRFLFYPWGVYVTAYARRNLFTAVLECGEDYKYSDTDSVKITNYENHIDYFNRYNQNIREKMQSSMKFNHMPYEFVEPETIEGKKKLIGVWDNEGTYDKFKTLGAKRYLTLEDGKYALTCAGVSKDKGVKYLISTGDPFCAFNEGLYIDGEDTGKLTHTYIDDEINLVLTDYKGCIYNIYEKSVVHLEPASYSLSISESYKNYLLSVKEKGRM